MRRINSSNFKLFKLIRLLLATTLAISIAATPTWALQCGGLELGESYWRNQPTKDPFSGISETEEAAYRSAYENDFATFLKSNGELLVFQGKPIGRAINLNTKPCSVCVYAQRYRVAKLHAGPSASTITLLHRIWFDSGLSVAKSARLTNSLPMVAGLQDIIFAYGPAQYKTELEMLKPALNKNKIERIDGVIDVCPLSFPINASDFRSDGKYSRFGAEKLRQLRVEAEVADKLLSVLRTNKKGSAP
ncbi:MAG: hypothetical protein ABL901_12640 [Hyphomicrobiaceae bacterium]